MHPTFDLKTTHADGHAVVEVLGELDVAAAASFRRAVGDLMGGGDRHLVVDLAATSFVDSSGLGALLWAEHRLQAIGGEIDIVNLSPAVARIFEMAGLQTLLVH